MGLVSFQLLSFNVSETFTFPGKLPTFPLSTPPWSDDRDRRTRYAKGALVRPCPATSVFVGRDTSNDLETNPKMRLKKM